MHNDTPSTKEYRIYVHNLHGYMNTFMLGNGRPDIIIPGFDKTSNLSSTLNFHHNLIKWMVAICVRIKMFLIYVLFSDQL